MSERLDASSRAHVVIFQKRLVHYRVAFFEKLRERLARERVKLSLVHGATTVEGDMRKDSAELHWARSVAIREFLGGRLMWLPMPAGLRRADLVVVTQENKILSNYVLQLARPFVRRRLAFWGHGRNLQSDSPHGLSERWKRIWAKRVDWWFAYTEGTRREVEAMGYPGERISVLDNTIDGASLQADLLAAVPLLTTFTAEHGIESGAPVAIYCGSLVPDKRLDLVIAVGDLVASRLPGFRLLVLGAGSEEGMMRQAASTRPWLRLLGLQKGLGKAVAFRAAKVLLNPGAVGLNVIDSFVTGCPLVTVAGAKHGPEAEYLQDGRNARVLPSDHADALGQAVCELLAPGSSQLAQLRQACEADAKRYTLDAMVENFVRGVLAALPARR